MGTERLPVVLVIFIGVPGERVPALVDDVAQLQVLGAACWPVFVLDNGDLCTDSPVRLRGRAVIAKEAWEERRESWETYLRRRLAALRTSYRSSTSVTLTAAGLGDVERALLAGSA